MTEPDFAFLSRLIREMQAEMRTIRRENGSLHHVIDDAVATLTKVIDNRISDLHDRMAAFEARIESRLDQTEHSLEERLSRIEEKIGP